MLLLAQALLIAGINGRNIDEYANSKRPSLRRIRGSNSAGDRTLSFGQIIQRLPEESKATTRRLQTKGCVTKLSDGRGGAGAVSKCATGSGGDNPGRGGKTIATSCTEVTTQHQIPGDGRAIAAHNFEGPVIDPPCDFNYYGRGTWWTYVGTGEPVMVSTCHSFTNISTALFLYQATNGFDCNSLECFARSNRNQCGNGGFDAFFASKDIVYYLTLLGDNGNNRNVMGPQGTMAISVTRQSNGCSSNLMRLDGRGTVVYEDIGENSPFLGPQCDSTLHGKGSWFEFMGTGENVLLSTCHDASTIPSVLTVYGTSDGDDICSDLDCKGTATASQDCVGPDGTSKGALLKIKADDDQLHLVSVVGDNKDGSDAFMPGPEGTFGINVIREFNGCDADLALPLLDDGSVTVAEVSSGSGSPLLGPQCDQNYNGRGQWYQFIGKAEPLLISSCHSETTIPTTISLYETAGQDRTCQRSSCKAIVDSSVGCGNGTGSAFILPNAIADRIYYMSILGDNGNVLYPSGPEGKIGVSVLAQSNGCKQAATIQDDGTLRIFNSRFGSRLGPQCDTQYNGKGNWFRFVGHGRAVEASTCHPATQITTAIAVYRSSFGECEGHLTCLNMSTSSSGCANGLGNTIRFFAEEGVEYKIAVFGDNGNTLQAGPEGRIAFSLTRDMSCPCWTALELELFTPSGAGGEYLPIACNTMIFGSSGSDLSVPRNQASISILNTDGFGATLHRQPMSSLSQQDEFECVMEGPLTRITNSLGGGVSSLRDVDIEDCTSLLYARCSELAASGLIDSSFPSKCSEQDFVETITLAEGEAGYDNCMEVSTMPPTAAPTEVPTSSPTISCPCWTAQELALVTPIGFSYDSASCNTEITGDLALPANPANRASIRVVNTFGFGARIIRLGAEENQEFERIGFDENQFSCSMSGAITRNTFTVGAEQVSACLELVYERCEFLSGVDAVPSSFGQECSLDDFTRTFFESENEGPYDNCLSL